MSGRRTALLLALAASLALPALAQGKKSKAGEEDAPAAEAGAGQVDLNSADEAALESLPGIGPSKAKAIIAARPFSSVDDLSRVKGIGPKTLDKLRPFVTVQGAAAPVPPSAAGSAAPPAPEAPVAASAAPAPARAGPADPENEPPGGKLNLNLASEKDLMTLPGIGEGKARAIVARRADQGPFRSLAEFRDMPGIGDRMFSELKYFVTVKVDANAASEAELVAVGMAPAAARKLVLARGKGRLKSLAAVREASGLSSAEFQAVAPLLWVEDR